MGDMKQLARFWKKVDRTDTCWLWTGALGSHGYGNVRFNRRYMRAHRVSFQIANPDVDITGLDVDHRCHVTACVNPNHLRAVSRKQNQEHRLGAQRNSSSGVRGVRWEADRGKWLARVKHNRRTINVGRFYTLAEAAEAVRLKRIELFTHNDMDYQNA